MKVYENPQRQWLAAAERDLADRIREKQLLEGRIAQLRLTIKGLRLATMGANVTVDRSLSDLCQEVLGFRRGEFQSVPEVKAALESIGVNVPGKNPHAVLHTTLARLADRGHIVASGTSPIRYQVCKISSSR